MSDEMKKDVAPVEKKKAPKHKKPAPRKPGDKKAILPIDDVVQVVPGGEALCEEIGEIQAGLLQYRDASGRIRGGKNDPYSYRVIPMDIADNRALQISGAWRTQGYSEVSGIECIGLPGGRVFRTSRENAIKISALKAKKALADRRSEAAPAGMRGTEVSYSESSGE